MISVQEAIMEAKQMQRVMRRPAHTWNLVTRPFAIVPFMIAPVLPGETLKNASLQARVVTDPIKNPLSGWWNEYYVFYVKHRDLDARDDMQKLVLQPGFDMAAYRVAAVSTDFYEFKNAIKWQELCYKRVVEEYFRDEGDVWNAASSMLGNYAMARVSTNSFVDSLTSDVAMDSGGSPQDGTESLDDLDRMQQQWEFMRANMLTQMSYEEFLHTYGVRTGRQELNRPELLRYVRDWSYPTNTVEPTTGVPTTALSWSASERIDKDRFFKEPGFIFGVTVCRPKIFFSGQKGAAVGLMDDAFAWLPALMRDEPFTSVKKVAFGSVSGNGPFTIPTADYWVDIRDLFLYGDQLANFALPAGGAGGANNMTLLPDANLNRRFLPAADIDALFSGANKTIRQDGIINLQIAGTQVDQT